MVSRLKPFVLKIVAVLLAVFMVTYCIANGFHIEIYRLFDSCRICVCSGSSSSGNGDCVQTKTNPKFNICIYGVDEDVHVSNSIRTYGHWDNDLTLKVHAALTMYPNATFVDIGANIGYFTLYACALSKNVVAIEAVNRNTKMIYRGLALNNCKGNVVVLNNAISNAKTTVFMTENRDKNMGGLAVWKEQSTTNDKSSLLHQSWIEAITLDDILPYVGSKEVVIKMDIEGFECKALESSIKFFQEKIVHYVFMEWLVVGDRLRKPNTSCSLEAAKNMVDRLDAMGFIPSEYNPKQRALDVKKMEAWTAYDIVWHRKDF